MDNILGYTFSFYHIFLNDIKGIILVLYYINSRLFINSTIACYILYSYVSIIVVLS